MHDPRQIPAPMPRLGACIGIAIVTACLLAPLPAAAGDLAIRVAPGESLSALARHYYGAGWKAIYITTRNGLPDDAGLDVGQKLVLPASWTYRIHRGDSLAAIAKRYLGSNDRYQAVMEENHLSSPNIAVGTVLLMPFHLRYEVRAGDSWSRISLRFYRTRHLATMLSAYNDNKKLKPGYHVTVPIFDRTSLTIRSRGPLTPPSRTPPAPRSHASHDHSKVSADERSSPKLRAQLAALVSDYKQGRFHKACPALEDMMAATDLGTADRLTLLEYLGFCSVAFGDTDAAADYFRKWIELDPEASLDPVTTSPKIMAVFRKVAAKTKKH